MPSSSPSSPYKVRCTWGQGDMPIWNPSLSFLLILQIWDLESLSLSSQGTVQ